ncbi:cytochrome P450 [Pholiota molesta]|nr:cytochrome P450 [Pholiota molesta]
MWADILLALSTHVWLRNYQPKSLRRLLAPIALIPGVLSIYYDGSISLRSSLYSYSIFILTLLSSIIAYRTSPFHPLSQYPGPAICKISKLWTAFIAYRGRGHQYHQALHAIYGPIVRVGSPGLPKGPLWDGRSFSSTNEQNDNNKLISVKNPSVTHSYGGPGTKLSRNPIEKLRGNSHQRDQEGHIDLARWISYLTYVHSHYLKFDFMGVMAFGAEFNLVRDGDKDGIFKIWRLGSWSSIKKFALFAMKQAKIRCDKDVQKHDLFYFMRLRQEIDEAFSYADCTPIDISQLAELKLLNAVANEALRLQPPLPNSLQRAPPEGSEGKTFGTTFIPEGTAVVIPPYTLHRHPAYFSPRTEEFWPERWLIKDDPAIVLDLEAFIPFSFGPANCAGKPLAMQELRYITAYS